MSAAQLRPNLPFQFYLPGMYPFSIMEDTSEHGSPCMDIRPITINSRIDPEVLGKLLSEIVSHREDSYTTLIYLSQEGIPLFDITHADDGSYGVSLIPPVIREDPVMWWKITDPPEDNMHNFLLLKNCNMEKAVGEALTEYLKRWGWKLDQMRAQRQVKSYADIAKDSRGLFIPDPISVGKTLMDALEEAYPKATKPTFAYMDVDMPPLSKADIDAVIAKRAEKSKPVPTELQASDYPSVLGEQSILMHQMIQADRDENEELSKYYLSLLEAIHRKDERPPNGFTIFWMVWESIRDFYYKWKNLN